MCIYEKYWWYCELMLTNIFTFIINEKLHTRNKIGEFALYIYSQENVVFKEWNFGQEKKDTICFGFFILRRMKTCLGIWNYILKGTDPKMSNQWHNMNCYTGNVI
jgi:hypothetical protein